jgi:gas vesicle protein
MNERDPQQHPSGSGVGVAALLLGLIAGAAALLLATKPGQRLLEQFSDRTEEWKAQAAAAVAETREKVVSSVEAETLPASDPAYDSGGRVREYL